MVGVPSFFRLSERGVRGCLATALRKT